MRKARKKYEESSDQRITLDLKELAQKIDTVIEQQNKVSDREWIIICGTFLEEHIKSNLEVFLVRNKKIEEELFKDFRPLGTHKSRMLISYYLGLISEKDYKILDFISKMRNMVAHNIETSSFENQELKNLVLEMKKILKATKINGFFISEMWEKEIKHWFFSDKIREVFSGIFFIMAIKLMLFYFYCSSGRLRELSFSESIKISNSDKLLLYYKKQLDDSFSKIRNMHLMYATDEVKKEIKSIAEEIVKICS